MATLHATQELFVAGLPAEDFESTSTAVSISVRSWYGEDFSAARLAVAEIVRLRARGQVQKALRDGRLTRPSTCERCPSPGPLHSHHADYSKPLAVTFLCADCHRKETARIKAAAQDAVPRMRGAPAWVAGNATSPRETERETATRGDWHDDN